MTAEWVPRPTGVDWRAVFEVPVEPEAPNGTRPATSAPKAEKATTDLFRRWTMPELLDADRTFRWLVRGMWVDPTYGQIAGEMKTLKSHVATFIHVAVAAGVKLFDRFVVDEPRPVVIYVGEGGRIPYTRRLERIARAMGVELRDLPLYPSFDVAPVLSLKFQETLERDLTELAPGLVALDPLYAYHGIETKSSDLHQEGSLLSSLSMPCVEAGASLQICNHYNQTGTGDGLRRITQAGSGEWVDSWILLSHREPPIVDEGKFRLSMEIGSRQWGGTSWDLDMDLGRFDPDAGEHLGDITWALRRHQVQHEAPEEERILEVLHDQPWELTKSRVRAVVGGNRQAYDAAWRRLDKTGRIAGKHLKMAEEGREVTRERWGTPDEPCPEEVQVGPGSEES